MKHALQGRFSSFGTGGQRIELLAIEASALDSAAAYHLAKAGRASPFWPAKSRHAGFKAGAGA